MEDDQGCVQQSYIFISHNYTFDSAGFVLIDLTYTHPNVPDEIFLTSQNLTVEFGKLCKSTSSRLVIPEPYPD